MGKNCSIPIGAAPAIPVAGGPVRTALVGHWRLNDGARTTTFDGRAAATKKAAWFIDRRYASEDDASVYGRSMIRSSFRRRAIMWTRPIHMMIRAQGHALLCAFVALSMLLILQPASAQIFYADFEDTIGVNDPAQWVPDNAGQAWGIADFPGSGQGLKNLNEGCDTSGNTPLPGVTDFMDGIIQLDMSWEDDDSWGVIFRKTAEDAGYLVVFGYIETPAVIIADLAAGCATTGNCLDQVSCENNPANTLIQVDHGLGGGLTQDLSVSYTGRIEAKGDMVRVWFLPTADIADPLGDLGEPLVEIQDGAHAGPGSVGIWHESQGGSMIDNVLILGLGAQALAWSPNPPNGALINDTQVNLSWRPGDFAVSHNVYFGDDPGAVGAATPDDADVFVGGQAAEVLAVGTADGPAPDGLVPGQTYYWRVDEVNDVEPNSPWKGNVWSFRVRPQIAWNPTPSDGLPYVSLEQDLSWEPGINALFHTVYVGESFDEVNEVVIGGMSLTGLTFDPGPLAAGTTYYWRVDEFTSPAAITFKGDVWSFTTVPDVAVTDPDLVGWWTFDEGVGMTAVDWSGHGNHGTMLGDPQRVDGYFGDALAFDGSGAYVNCGNAPALTIRDEITVACWIKVASFTRTWETILAKGDNSYRMSRGPGDGDSIHFGCNGPTGGNLNATTTVTDNTWHHVTLVYDGTNKIIYIDGVEDARLASDGQIDQSTYDLYVGANSQQAGRFLEGLVDDVRIYSRALTEDEIQDVMRGNPLLAGNPEPGPGAMVDIRDATALRWSPGDTAASHDVYFGTERSAVADAGTDAAEYQGNQPGTTFSLAGLVEFGGGDYFWRIDEVEADATTIHEGYTWRFTVPAYLIVDDFESYDDDENRLYEIWVDGVVNGTGSYVGYAVANNGTFGETVIVHGGRQSMPIQYDNTGAPGISEADHTFSPAQDWTAEGVTTLVIHFRGDAANAGQLYVKINGTKVPYDGDPADIASTQWVAWEIDLASVGVNLTSVTTLTIGIEGGGTGTVYVDDIWLTK